MNLTEHFTVEEFIASDTAVRLGIDNMPQDGDVIIRMTKVAQAMEQVRKILGAPIKINSGYRCEELERVLCAKDFAAWCKRQQPIGDSVCHKLIWHAKLSQQST